MHVKGLKISFEHKLRKKEIKQQWRNKIIRKEIKNNNKNFERIKLITVKN